jgi:hypothetical protein
LTRILNDWQRRKLVAACLAIIALRIGRYSSIKLSIDSSAARQNGKAINAGEAATAAVGMETLVARHPIPIVIEGKLHYTWNRALTVSLTQSYQISATKLLTRDDETRLIAAEVAKLRRCTAKTHYTLV